MDWHWLYNNQNDLPQPGKPVIVLRGNGQVMSSESLLHYDIDAYHIGDKYIGFIGDSAYFKAVAGCYIDEPDDKGQFLK